ncbi:putative lipid scramblase CLPTM1 [Mytilus trossulus]|uniref:putative lipid scramblase CLPTM1 n=1 Tax=Mytilus trossulus TaxID=6551 RepID=UPI003005C1BF
MADNVPVASAANSNEVQNAAPAADQARPGFFGTLKTLVVRMLFIYMISSFFRRGSTPTTGTEGQPEKQYSQNLFPKNLQMDLYMYLSEQEAFSDFDNENALVWKKTGLMYGDWTSGPNGDGSYEKSMEIDTPESVQNNGSIYLHVYFVKEGKSPNPKDKLKYLKRYTVYNTKRLNKFKKRKFQNTVNLLTGETDVHPDLIKKENMSSFEILSHWHPNLTINMMDDHTPWARGSLPAPLDEYVEFVPGGEFYYPVIYFNDYWNLNTEYQPLNDTVKKLNLTLSYSPISLLRWQMYAAQNMRSKWYSMLGADFMEDSDNDQDSLKTAIIETNPYLLAMTIIVSIVHSVFEFLAFKNDIQFWRNRKSLEGLSVRSVFFNVFQSIIVVLYVQDNETNMMVRISIFIGLIIEIWKIQKVITIKLDRENLLFGLIPRPTFEDKSTYTQSHTKKYDMMAFKYLSWALFPLLGGYAVYSLLYLEHKGWYSWVLNMLYGFLLTFGFIMMTPQLFINYKLKSVAHLPWRMMTYKALNTFIDDIFAFVIKMPMLYRIGCFRDDIVFFIFLYQRYIYRIDPKRVNEFGTSQDMLDPNGDIMPEQSEAIESSPSEAIESSQSDVKEPSQSAEEKTEQKDSNGEAHLPKSADDKKND